MKTGKGKAKEILGETTGPKYRKQQKRFQILKALWREYQAPRGIWLRIQAEKSARLSKFAKLSLEYNKYKKYKFD